mgnify:CR=1 FL=1
MNTVGSLPWRITFFPGMTSVLPISGAVKSEGSLKRMFGQPKEYRAEHSKKSLPCWSPAIYAQGSKRANDSVLEITSLVYDLDYPKSSIEEMTERLDGIGVAYIIHSTWSHRPSSPRYRLVFPISRPLTPPEYPIAWENGLRVIGLEAGIDRQARNISRHYALPAQVEGEEYICLIKWEGKVLNSDSLSRPEKEKGKGKLDPTLMLELADGSIRSVADLLNDGAEKYKCKCPFQEDASMGSAFFRVLKDGRAFIQCTSERHGHKEHQVWLGKSSKDKKKRSAPRSVEDRIARLEEIPDELRKYIEERIAYNAPQGVFYRYSEGGWQISLPMKKESLTDHLVGLLPVGCDRSHAFAMIDHVLSRQVYGFDCKAIPNPIIQVNEIPLLNLYSWPDLSPAIGKCGRIEQILDLLCDGNAEAKKWILHWSASLIQHPTRRSMVAVLVLSPQQGIGKSLYGRLLQEIIGKKNATVVSNRALRDNFNSHYVTSLLVLADEIGIDRGSSDTIAEIKAAITDDRVHCAAPYAARTTVTNRMTWWMTSNRRRPFIIEQDDRRFSILSPGPAHIQYRKMLRACFDAKTGNFAPDFYDEICAFADHLQQVQIDWNLISRPLTSPVKSQLQSASLGSVDSFISELIARGPVEILSEYPPPPNYIRMAEASITRAVPCETVYGSYREWCIRKGRTDIRSETILRLTVGDMPGMKIRPARVGGRKIDVYIGLTVPKSKPSPQGKVVNFGGEDS